MTQNKRPFDRLRRIMFGKPWSERNLSGKISALLLCIIGSAIIFGMIANAYAPTLSPYMAAILGYAILFGGAVALIVGLLSLFKK